MCLNKNKYIVLVKYKIVVFPTNIQKLLRLDLKVSSILSVNERKDLKLLVANSGSYWSTRHIKLKSISMKRT